MSKIEHNHYMDAQYHTDCPRCKLNEAAPNLLEALRRAYFLLETNNIKDEYFEILRVGLGDLLPSQIVDAELTARTLYIPGVDEAANAL